jgi:hypothetical protein
MLPNGRKKAVEIVRPAEVEAKARKVIEAGGRFEIEVLLTGEINMEVLRVDDSGEDECLAIEICPNGPDVPVVVDRLIETAFAVVKQS